MLGGGSIPNGFPSHGGCGEIRSGGIFPVFCCGERSLWPVNFGSAHPWSSIGGVDVAYAFSNPRGRARRRGVVRRL
jgi:hypothetical protein